MILFKDFEQIKQIRYAHYIYMSIGYFLWLFIGFFTRQYFAYIVQVVWTDRQRKELLSTFTFLVLT